MGIKEETVLAKGDLQYVGEQFSTEVLTDPLSDEQ
jgi:hypothetical protein